MQPSRSGKPAREAPSPILDTIDSCRSSPIIRLTLLLRLNGDSDGNVGGGALPVRLSARYVCIHGLSVILLTLATGCPVVQNLPSPGRVVKEREPESQRPYSLYVPANYTDTRRWPLVITCHGTPPYDTATAQFNEWRGLAERRGFLLAAPDLVGTRGDLTPPPTEQIRRQMEDEQAILGLVRTIQAAYAIDDSRVFLTGWSAGSYAALFTGLRHPGIFRAISVRQGNFDPAFVQPCVPFLDRYQPIQVLFGSEDLLLGKQPANCIAWLRSHDLEPTVLERPGFHRREPSPVVTFFSDTATHRPWIRVSVKDDPATPMKLTFSVRSTFEPTRYLWDFGDQTETSPLPSPTHTYEKNGSYVVRVALWPTKGNPHVRRVQVQIPRVRLGLHPTATTRPAQD
ncbi:MAG TPA: PKD domain-containing protein [Phycisphaerae bacterium]|nr:PKD domain-containing protein [Phycisphaerae bacterium]HRY69433.1 PKD domain-containing protein [Phycisphaerae bacterium]HSA26300.1 PKD domain-containing protein [Phycisphaerae bacterium]